MTFKTNRYSIFIIICLFSFGHFYAQIKTTETPQWVIQQSYEKSPNIDLNEISYGLLTLLSDEQIHIPKKERYIRIVRKITDYVGVQDGSSISINYDPTYQQLFLHSITVLRNGKTINKLNVDDFQSIRQESNAESYIYDGSLNAIANLADIRNGDILDLSYTIKGFNPIHGNHFSGGTTLNDFQPVGKINYYLIANKTLYYKTLNCDIKPKIASYNGYKTYNWTTTLTKTPQFEENTPSWYLPYQDLFVTDFKSWDAVVNWALHIYQDDTKLSEALKSKIEHIKNSTEYEGERISATLKFVQNEIRYLGLESGIGAYKPFSPNKVLEQRFGDCKDKSWLMITMLRQMGIEAYPVLINSAFGESLHQFLPSPKAFDHVVVKVVDSTNTNLFYDPTISNQFGSYKKISFPNYGKALVIKKGVNALEKIKSKNEDLVEVFDTFDLPTVGGPATLNVMTVYRDAEADAVRTRFKSSSLSSISKEFKNYYDNLYDGVEVLKDPVIDDDSLSNKILVEESYKINDIWIPMVGNDKNINVEFSPYSILDIFYSPDEKERKTPFALYYPSHKKHQITVKLPQRWSIANDNVKVNSKSFDFSLKTKMNRARDIMYLNYEYRNKAGFVKPEDFEDYYTKIKEVEQIIAYYVYIPKSESKSRSFEKSFDTEKITSNLATLFFWIAGIVSIVVIGLIIYVVRSNKNRD
ncbi:DUF3857 domain-containing transglutaminase family protein [uncultured Psychroserpens sp.]|uniref:DUF3857 domain-containing transglutaminase family protein n=1 Tax=uncultured Psychroserpens sp. TaxID=255436 RepID=UPI002626187F|nr:DUF3857 domain-containing transglutaminase family protein [uncultured Psychroserpens sp.]